MFSELVYMVICIHTCALYSHTPMLLKNSGTSLPTVVTVADNALREENFYFVL